jgi:hypothetical protein
MSSRSDHSNSESGSKDKGTFVFLYLIGAFVVLFLKEFFRWLKEGTDEDLRLGANDGSEKEPGIRRIFELCQITQILQYRRSREVHSEWTGESCVPAMEAVSMMP